MKTYTYWEYGEIGPREITEDQIIEQYWPFWSEKMKEIHGENSPLITRANCIDDWAVVNWAVEKKS